jgi:hypothetical protein
MNDKSKGWVKGTPQKFVNPQHAIKHASAVRSARAVGNKGISTGGYVVLRIDGKRIYEHIHVAQIALGRQLRRFGHSHADNEVVHHINGCKTDNRTENLLVCTNSYHLALHHRLSESSAWPEFKQIVRNERWGRRARSSN